MTTVYQADHGRWISSSETLEEATTQLVIESATTGGRIEFFADAAGSWFVVVRPGATWRGSADISQVSFGMVIRE